MVSADKYKQSPLLIHNWILTSSLAQKLNFVVSCTLQHWPIASQQPMPNTLYIRCFPQVCADNRSTNKYINLDQFYQVLHFTLWNIYSQWLWTSILSWETFSLKRAVFVGRASWPLADSLVSWRRCAQANPACHYFRVGTGLTCRRSQSCSARLSYMWWVTTSRELFLVSKGTFNMSWMVIFWLGIALKKIFKILAFRGLGWFPAYSEHWLM